MGNVNPALNLDPSLFLEILVAMHAGLGDARSINTQAYVRMLTPLAEIHAGEHQVDRSDLTAAARKSSDATTGRVNGTDE